MNTNKRKVIARKNLPMPAPIAQTVVAWLLLDRVNAPGWLWGAMGTVFALLWLGWLVYVLGLKQIDVFAWDTPRLNGTGPYDRATVATEAAKERRERGLP